ncbi:hypothetical protein HY501_02865 [Candidatus Woesearchaeota archaeon]|nr:hypothetical protein [Candidatus Woesearchaeota archaeon]
MEINVAKPVIVLKKSKLCIKPYSRQKALYLTRSHCASKAALRRHIKKASLGWEKGEYLIRAYLKTENTMFTPTLPLAQVSKGSRDVSIDIYQ